MTVTGTIVDSVTGEPVARAFVYQPNGNRTETGADGRFSLRQVERSGAVIMVRRIGYAPRADRMGLLPAGGDLGRIGIVPLAVALDSVSVEARLVAQNPRLAEFYRRWHTGQGVYLTREEIWARNPIAASDLLKAIPGIRYFNRIPQTTRSGTFFGCPMQVLLDGFPTTQALDDIPPAWIAGIEIYKSTGRSPVEFGASGRGNRGPQCGVIAIWTGGEVH